MNILVVEDDTTDMKLFHVILTSSGHVVSGEGSAEDAIDAIRRGHPEVILLDLKLPGKDGLALTRRLKADPETRDIPIIAITAAGETFGREEALAAGCAAYIRKPVDTRTLNDDVVRVAGNATAARGKEPGP
ncbi:MAG: response regulator [Candidatus Hydrogenedentes bacterium]|nr:response regulator [Candidatus Hydrogenedentota bacterium]